MNNEFEKIIEKLAEESKKWLDVYEKEHLKGNYNNYADGMNDAFDEAIEIVKQEAEQYNNGWIPVSEKLPEDYETYLVTNVDSFGQRHTYKGWYGVEHKIWHMEGNSERKMNVVAWQPLPKPYQPKGEMNG